MSFKAIAIILALVAGSIAMFRIQVWYRRNENRAPVGLQIAIVVTLISALVLAEADLVPLDTALTLAVALSLIAAVWGWVRYHGSPYLRRWEATWREIETHLASDDLDAADKVMTAAHKQDDAEREELRAVAPNDRSAALEFQRRTKSELKAWARGAARFARTVGTESSNASAGALVFSVRRQRLEADLDWIRAVLSGPSGAA
jgi:Ca2+/Na+ antiporter